MRLRKVEKVTLHLTLDKSTLDRVDSLRLKLAKVGPKVSRTTLISILLESGLSRTKERSR